jgi:alkanesulfonate monooxygenase SsuD/methylene tetrahydromethanopterin reductase-like flavin-dependent oxidoreductase (luciferase family)
MERTREFVTLVRRCCAARARSRSRARTTSCRLDGGAHLGKPLKLITKPLRADIPIYLGAEGPKNIRMATEIADGWLPLYYSPFRPEVYADSLGKLKPGFEIACPVTVSTARRPRAGAAARQVDARLLHRRHGRQGEELPSEPDRARSATSARRRRSRSCSSRESAKEAAAAVPDRFADEISLAGPAERIRDRLAAWKTSKVTTLIAGTRDKETLRVLAEAAA